MVLRRELDDRPKHANMELYEMHEHARIQDSATQHEHVELDRLDDKTLGTDRQLGRDSDREVSMLTNCRQCCGLTVSLSLDPRPSDLCISIDAWSTKPP